MLKRSRQPLSETDRQILEQYRQSSIGTRQFDAKCAFLFGVAGLMIGSITAGVLEVRGDLTTPFGPIVALAAAGTAFGFPFDYFRNRAHRRTLEAAASAKWDPVISFGAVEHIIADATKAVRLDDNEGNTAWLLQVTDDQILCVWDWANDASEHVEIDVVPATPVTALKISWTGKKLSPLRPKRRFKRGERQPEQCEIIHGTLEDLDTLLRQVRNTKRAPRRKTEMTPSMELADDVESIGFYKYVAPDQIEEIKGEIEHGAYEWFLAANRMFDADAERLAEGGVKDLLDYMRPMLKVEGWEVESIAQSYDSNQGYTIRMGADEVTMWGPGEANRSWELTTIRTITLINERLAKVGSDERVHVLDGGEDASFVLLTAAMRRAIEQSGLFVREDILARL